MGEEHENIFTESSTTHGKIVDTYFNLSCSLAPTVKT
jgi:hypothetical protein